MNDFQQAEEAAQIGIRNSASSAQRAHDGWVEEAAEALGWAASACASAQFTIEALRAMCWQLSSPPDLRAWGAATKRAIKLGYVVKTNMVAVASSSNNSPKPVYVKGAWR